MVRQSSETLMQELSSQFTSNVVLEKPRGLQIGRSMPQQVTKPNMNSSVLGKRTMFDANPRKKRFVAPPEPMQQSPPRKQQKNPFMSARQKLFQDDVQNGRNPNRFTGSGGRAPGLSKKKISGNVPSYVKRAFDGGKGNQQVDDIPERLKGNDPKLLEMIENEMLEKTPEISFNDIAGLDLEKKEVQKIVVWPLQRPDLFTGLRSASKGILLFGPPGTGKTMIGKAIASSVNAKFFSISSSSLTSKWHGEGEKLVKALFAMAGHHAPSIIFIDEIDSLLSQRNSKDYEASRRIKTEFLVQLDGCGTLENEQVVVIGATNRPQELDEAARRRLVKKLYIPLPEFVSRKALILKLLKGDCNLGESDVDHIAQQTEGYSGADIKALCREAAHMALDDALQHNSIQSIDSTALRGVNRNDFLKALQKVRPSVSPDEITAYVQWNRQFGCFQRDDMLGGGHRD